MGTRRLDITCIVSGTLYYSATMLGKWCVLVAVLGIAGAVPIGSGWNSGYYSGWSSGSWPSGSVSWPSGAFWPSGSVSWSSGSWSSGHTNYGSGSATWGSGYGHGSGSNSWASGSASYGYAG